MSVIKVEVEIRTIGIDPQQVRDLGRRLEGQAHEAIGEYLTLVATVLPPDGPTYYIDSNHQIEEGGGA